MERLSVEFLIYLDCRRWSYQRLPHLGNVYCDTRVDIHLLEFICSDGIGELQSNLFFFCSKGRISYTSAATREVEGDCRCGGDEVSVGRVRVHYDSKPDLGWPASHTHILLTPFIFALFFL